MISGLALVKSIAVSTVFLSDKSSALLKSVEETVVEEVLLETCERADPLESWRLSNKAANSLLTAASSLGIEAKLEAVGGAGLLSTLILLLRRL